MARNSLVPSSQSPGTFLEQVVGPGKGRIVELAEEPVSIGRSEDNKVVIPSGSVSRHHALVVRDTEGNFLIKDNGSKNGISVNGNIVSESGLRDGDVVQMGDFVFRFNDPNSRPLAPPEAAPEAPYVAPEPVAAPGAFSGVAAQAQDAMAQIGLKPTKRGGGRRSNRPLLYGGLLLVGAMVYFMGGDDKPKTTAKSDKADSAAVSTEKPSDKPYMNNLDPKSAQVPQDKTGGLDEPGKTASEVALENLDPNNTTLREAEQNFRKGRREYLAKNYQRAIQSFQAALSFDRQHRLARFYLQLSVAEAEADAMKQMELGVKYFQSLQYDRAIYHFNQVMAMMAHRPQHQMVPKARDYVKKCQDLLRAAEMFP